MRRLLLLLALAACGSDDSMDPGDDDTDGSDDPGNDNDDDDDTPADDTPTDDGPSDATEFGYVSLSSADSENIDGSPRRYGSAGAGFYAEDGSDCVITEEGPCTILTCTVFGAGGATSAGAITIGGAAEAITLQPDAGNVYPSSQSEDPLFTGGETLTISAAGADIEAFTSSITAPAKPIVTSPTPPSGAAMLTVPRSTPFTASWTGGGAGDVYVQLNGDAGRIGVSCRYPASAGTGTVPVAALAALPAGLGGLQITASATDRVVVLPWEVSVSAYFAGEFANGTGASLAVTLQ